MELYHHSIVIIPEYFICYCEFRELIKLLKFLFSSNITGYRRICVLLEGVKYGRAIAQAVSRWLPTAAARVQIRV
jgi:hypothetical protein